MNAGRSTQHNYFNSKSQAKYRRSFNFVQNGGLNGARFREFGCQGGGLLA
jgi:hypothetical protein